jgi:outer membrane protein assembly factor BamB
MSKDLKLVWEALHDEGARFALVKFSASDKAALLAYSGKAVRTGFFLWQKNKLGEPAELQAVRYGADEPMWSASLGADLDLASLHPDDTYKALGLLGLRRAHSTWLAQLAYSSQSSALYGVDAQTGEVRWHRLAAEFEEYHVPEGAESFVYFAPKAAPVLASTRTGEVLAPLQGRSADADVVHLGGLLLALEDDGTLYAHTADGKEAWKAPAGALSPGTLHESAVLRGDKVVVVAPGSVRAFSASTGGAIWQQRGPDGPKLVLVDAGAALVVQDVSNNGVGLLDAQTGNFVASKDFSRLLHWTGRANRLIGATVDGELSILDAATGQTTLRRRYDGLRLIDARFTPGRIWALAVVGEGEAYTVLEIHAGTADIIRRAKLDENDVALEPLGDHEVGLLVPGRGAMVFAED